MAAVAALVLNAGQAQATASPSFDLVCNGVKGAQLHLRFDLAQKKWCAGECQSVWPIYDLSDSMIKLRTISGDGKDEWTIAVDRYTSNFSAVRSGYSDNPQDWGQCKAEPFSGFPSRKF